MNQLQVCRLQGVVNGKYNTYDYLFIKEIFLIKISRNFVPQKLWIINTVFI